MRGPKSLCFLVAFTAGSGGLLAQPFFFRQDVPVGPGMLTVSVGDFNGDHRPDLVFNAWNEGIYILLNQGGGNFNRAIQAGLRSNYFRRGLPLVADFNGDGKDDLATADGVFLSRGDGTFQAAQQFNQNGQFLTQLIAAGDLNRDGKSDLVISDATSGTRVLLSNGDGTFRSGPTVTGVRMDLAKVADLNRDGRADLICFGDTPPNRYAIFLGNGDGTFGSLIQVDAPFPNYQEIFFSDFIQVTDFNGDGKPDLALPAGILLGKGDGAFQTLIPYPPLGGSYTGLAVADFTGDSKADLIVGRLKDLSMLILPGKGDGTFGAPIESVGLADYQSVAAVDLDGDGRLDLAMLAGFTPNRVSVLIAKARWDPTFRRAVSASSGTAVVTPQSMATLFAPIGVTDSTTALPPWPTNLAGISLEVVDSAGASRLAPLLFVSPTQINFEVPSGTAFGEAALAIVDSRGKTQVGGMRVDTVAPGLFMAPGSLATPAATAILVPANGPPVLIPVFSGAPIPLSTADGPIYISFYGTGFRGANPDNVTCEINGTAMPVLYAGPQETPGVDQINIHLLPGVTPGGLWEDSYEVAIRIDGVIANPAWLNIR